MDKQAAYNIEMGLQIAEKYSLNVANGYKDRAVRYREKLKNMIIYGKPGKWARKKSGKRYKTYCGQYSSFFFLDINCDMTSFLRKKHHNNVNTTMQWTYAQKYNALEIDFEEAFYLACVALPGLILSPYHLEVAGIHYNHAAVIYPIFTEAYDSEIGPYIAQEGWYHFFGKPISDPRAWGNVWKNKKVKCFLPPHKA